MWADFYFPEQFSWEKRPFIVDILRMGQNRTDNREQSEPGFTESEKHPLAVTPQDAPSWSPGIVLRFVGEHAGAPS